MATIKVACPKCGQKVSGDENFFGTVVECPICSASIQFPGEKKEALPSAISDPVPPERTTEEAPQRDFPAAALGEEASVAASPHTGPVPVAPQEPAASWGDGPKGELEQERDFEGDLVVPSPVFGAISMVMALLGVVTCVFGILFAPVAIICGHIAQAKARRSPVQPAPGQTLGAIGMMIGYVWLVIAILILALAVLFKQPIVEFMESRNA